MNHFENINTIEELKKAYRMLAKKYHPDLGGSTEIMKQVNNQYEKLFNDLKKGIKNNTNFNVNDGFRQIIDKIIHMVGVEIEICGSWIWVSGETYKFKEALKEAGFQWAKKKRMWYWASEPITKKRSSTSMEKIRALYGSEKIKTEDGLKLA